jgi:hypothetical protein
MDYTRFTRGDEWGEPHISEYVLQYIFANPNPDKGLLLFILCCWLDMQARYTIVWSTYLRQAHNWINSGGFIPRHSFSPIAPHLHLTVQTFKKYGSITQWFIQTIVNIAQNHGKDSGNLYRFVGEVCSALFDLRKPRLIDLLKKGQLPANLSGGDQKRLWMFIMFLRRDNSVVKCLFKRALSRFPGGQRAIQYWYNPAYFDPTKCELPVDSNVFGNWNNLFKKMGMENYLARNRTQVACLARTIAQQFSISPSVFDSLLFF